MPPSFSDLVKLVQLGTNPFALAHRPSLTWPLSKYIHASDAPTSIRVAILDSSFNPPTIAHRAMLHSARPRPYYTENLTERADDPEQYDARLLLLSVRNVDKTLKPQDADFSQRAEMMTILSLNAEVSEATAVGLLDAPTFVAKALVLHSALLDMLPTGSESRIRMSWIIGLDTLERLFAPRYYTSEATMAASLHEFFDPGQGDNEVICAWRGDASSLDCIPQAAHEFVSLGRIRFLSLSDTLRTVSSSEIRNRRGAADDSWVDLAPAEVVEYIRQHQLYLPTGEPNP